MNFELIENQRNIELLSEIENKIQEMEDNIVNNNNNNNNNKKKKQQNKQQESSTSTATTNTSKQTTSESNEKVEKNAGSKKQTSSSSTNEGEAKKPQFQWKSLTGSVPSSFSDVDLENQTKIWLERLFSMENNSFLRTILETQLRGAIYQKSTLTDGALVKDLFNFLTWERSVVMLKEEWKESVTGGKFKGMGFKIDAHKAHVPSDDIIYQKNPLLQEYLPRGLLK